MNVGTAGLEPARISASDLKTDSLAISDKYPVMILLQIINADYKNFLRMKLFFAVSSQIEEVKDFFINGHCRIRTCENFFIGA